MIKKIMFWILALFLILATFTYYYRGEIVSYFIENEIETHLGEKIKQDIKLIDIHGKIVNIDQTFSESSVVLVYSESCSPCKDAIKIISTYLKNVNEIKKNFIVISFDMDKSEFIMSFNNFNYFRTNTSRKNTLFAGRMTPTFYIFSPSGTLDFKEIGWNDITYKKMFN